MNMNKSDKICKRTSCIWRCNYKRRKL